MKILSVISEKIKSSVLFNGAATGSAGISGIKPAGSNGVVLQALVTMGDATDLVLKVQTADDASGTNPVDLADVVPVFVDNVRQADDAKNHTVEDASGNFVVAFAVPPVLIPAGKFLCLANEASNAANILSAAAHNDVYHETGSAA